jgi:hypothetical protein
MERRARRHPNTFEADKSRQTVESECLTEYKEQRRREFRRKREEHCNARRGGQHPLDVPIRDEEGQIRTRRFLQYDDQPSGEGVSTEGR